MALQHLNKDNFHYKLACDGSDLNRHFSEGLLNTAAKMYAEDHTILHKPDFDVEAFVRKCVARRQAFNLTPRDLPEGLCDKYEVGVFTTGSDAEFASTYILLNQEQLDYWDSVDVKIKGLHFMVVPSRGWDGEINEVGFRFLQPAERVHEAFKWLFMMGQQGTFGMHLCDRNEQLILCEGFQDMVALRESGVTQAVGLGSAHIYPEHEEQLQTDNWLFCGDMDGYGLLQREDMYKGKYCFFKPQGKDPYEAWQKHGHVELVHIKEK